MFIWIDNGLELAIFEHKMKQFDWTYRGNKVIQRSGWIHLDKSNKTYSWSYGEFLIKMNDVIELKNVWKWGPYSKDDIRYKKLSQIL